MRRLGRWVRGDPWMAVTAGAATAGVTTVVSIRWLAVLGVVRDYAVVRTTGSLWSAADGWSSGTSGYHRQLGLTSGPSAALSHLDNTAWKLAFVAGVLWMLRLALRSAGHRIGTLRAFGVFLGFGLFVVTGVAHRANESITESPRARRRLDGAITL